MKLSKRFCVFSPGKVSHGGRERTMRLADSSGLRALLPRSAKSCGAARGATCAQTNAFVLRLRMHLLMPDRGKLGRAETWFVTLLAKWLRSLRHGNDLMLEAWPSGLLVRISTAEARSSFRAGLSMRLVTLSSPPKFIEIPKPISLSLSETARRKLLGQRFMRPFAARTKHTRT